MYNYSILHIGVSFHGAPDPNKSNVIMIQMTVTQSPSPIDWYPSSASCPNYACICIAALSSGAIAGISAGLVIVFILVILIVIIVLGILFYGYTHPSSSVGLFMIEVPHDALLSGVNIVYKLNSLKVLIIGWHYSSHKVVGC